MARTPLMAGNWKMNLNHLEAIALVQKLAFALTDKDVDACEVAVLPPFTATLALELAPHDILVNAIAPGPILAPPGTADDEMRAVEQATPLGRWGGEIEISKGVLALLESDFITGETIRIDGGRHVK